MKTRDTNLQPSEKLAPFVATYRNEPSLLSTRQVDELIAHRDQLPDSSLSTIRKAIMTLAGIGAVALIVYRAFIAHPTQNPSNTTLKDRHVRSPLNSHAALTQAELSEAENTPEVAPGSPPILLATRLQHRDRKSPLAAEDVQVYASLTLEELGRLGLFVSGDTILNYYLDGRGSLECVRLGLDFIRGGAVTPRPTFLRPTHLSPVLMTLSDGRGVAYHFETERSKEWGRMTSMDAANPLITWLRKPGTPGYHALGIRTTTHIVDGKEHDTVRVVIVKDLPLPSPIPVLPPDLDGLSSEQKSALVQLAHYAEGTAAQPRYSLPPTVAVVVDTLKISDLLEEIDKEMNSPIRQRIQGIVARLNELVPVIVRTRPGTGKPTSSDYIFWYEPSEELFAALPAAQAARFRKSAAPTHCLTAPNMVSKDATITYCSSSNQQVEAIVQDLAGHIIRIVLVDAHSGDNTLTIPTEVLPSGIYIVTIRMQDGSQQSRRIWSQNEHPSELPTGVMTEIPPNSAEHCAIYTFPSDFTPSQVLRHIAEDRGTILNFDIDSLLAVQRDLSSAQKSNIRESMLKARRNFESAAKSLKTNQANVESLVVPQQMDYLEPGQAGEEALGVENQDDLVAYYRQKRDKSQLDFYGILREWGVMTTQVEAGSVKHPTPQIYPTLITDALGRKRMTDITVPSDTVINQLVPVLFRHPGTTDELGGRDIVFWYKPTAEFLAALPDSLRATALDMTGRTSIVQARHSAQVQSLRTYPNPSKGSFSLVLTLDARKTVSVVVRNLLGQERARTLIDAAQGTSTHPLSFASLEDGLYMLEVTTDTGETQVSRIVIEH